MDTSAAVYNQALQMTIATRDYTRKILDELPGTVQEGQTAEATKEENSSKSIVSSSGSGEVAVSPSQQSTILGQIASHRVYRSLSKKHVVVLQEIDLKKPMGDEEMALLKKKLQQEQPVGRKQSENSLVVDYVPSEPKLFSHLRM